MGGREESHNFQGNKTVCSCQVQFIIIQKILVCGCNTLVLASHLIQRKFKVGFLIDILYEEPLPRDVTFYGKVNMTFDNSQM